MPKFMSGENPAGFRSVQWIDSSRAFRFQVVRLGIGTAESAEYPHAAADLLLGPVHDNGTTLNRLIVATEGVVKVINSLAGTVNLYDPVVLDFTNSNGTVGKMRSAYAREAIAAIGNASDVGTTLQTRIPLSNKAVPGSFRYGSGSNLISTLHPSGTVVLGFGTLGVVADEVHYTIDQPSLGLSKDKVTTPNAIFRVEIAKQRYIKNNIVN